MANLLKVKYGLNSQLPAVRDDDTLYFVTDTKQIYRGDIEYTGEVSSIRKSYPKGDSKQEKEILTINLKNGNVIQVPILSSNTLDAVIEVIGGKGDSTTKGLVKLSDETDSTLDVSGGTAATPKAVSSALEAAKNYTDEQIAAGFAANDAQVLKGSIAADGTITSTDTTINGKKINAITGYSTGWTFRVTAASTSSLWSNDASTKVEAGDMVLAIKDYDTANVSTDWSIIQSNLIGAVTTDDTALTANQVVLGNGTQKVKILSAGNNNQVLTIVDGKPTWANLPTEKDTTYTFSDGTDGSFTVTPSDGSAQKVNIGKPATARTADKVANNISFSIGSDNLISTTPIKFNGGQSTAITFGEAAAKNISTTVENVDKVITAAAVYDALTWKPFATD